MASYKYMLTWGGNGLSFSFSAVWFASPSAKWRKPATPHCGLCAPCILRHVVLCLTFYEVFRGTTLGFICISLMAKRGKHYFQGLFATWLSSLLYCLFKLLALFNWVISFLMIAYWEISVCSLHSPSSDLHFANIHSQFIVFLMVNCIFSYG